jgi:hypothetical protein
MRSSPLGQGECHYVVDINTSAKMLRFRKLFHIFKHFLLLNLVNLKLSCNNLISTLIMVLYASYVCLLHSHFVENNPIDLEVTYPSFLRLFYHAFGVKK